MPQRRRNDRRSRRRTDEESPDPEVATTPGSDDERGSEVTRCICGHQELHPSVLKHAGDSIDPGLFIQCEQCEVWQHGYCVGFTSEEDVPDVYYCERCKPECHLIVVRPTGRTSTYYPKGVPKEYRQGGSSASIGSSNNAGSGVESDSSSTRRTRDRESRADRADREQRRRTLNSRDAEYEETLKRVLEESKGDDVNKRTKEESDEEPSPPPRKKSKSPQEKSSRDRQANKKKEPRDENDRDVAAEDEEHEYDRASGNGTNQDTQDEDKERPVVTSDADTDAAGKRTKKRTPRARKHSDEDDRSQTDIPNGPETPRKQARKRQKNRKGGSGRSSGTQSKQELVEQSSKPRIPPPRSSMPELRRRVAAILEFVTRTKEDLAAELDERKQLIDQREQRRRLLFGDSTEQVPSFGLLDAYESNIEAIDSVTKKLVMWEESFGQYEVN
uniref:ARAD1C40546p n=1 Tax=Blastobotrys adeninivorans TaxID=409370 RepID=A0A060T3I3_BLAAD